MIARKEDTRHKIQLGGLIVKTGIDVYPSDVILGALSLVSKSLHGEQANVNLEKYKIEGARLFLEEKNLKEKKTKIKMAEA